MINESITSLADLCLRKPLIFHRNSNLVQISGRRALVGPSSIFLFSNPTTSGLSPDWQIWEIGSRLTSSLRRLLLRGHRSCTWIILCSRPRVLSFCRNFLKLCIFHQERKAHEPRVFRGPPSAFLGLCLGARRASKWSHLSLSPISSRDVQ